MHHSRLCQHRNIAAIGERDQVVEVIVDGLRGRRYVERVAWRVVAATDPVLHIPDAARVAPLVRVVGHQCAVCREDRAPADVRPVDGANQCLECLGRRGHRCRRGVRPRTVECACVVVHRRVDVLDLGRGDRFGPQQEGVQGLEMRAVRVVQSGDLGHARLEVRADRRRNPDLTIRDQGRQHHGHLGQGPVVDGSAPDGLAPRPEFGHVRRPGWPVLRSCVHGLLQVGTVPELFRLSQSNSE